MVVPERSTLSLGSVAVESLDMAMYTIPLMSRSSKIVIRYRVSSSR